MNSKSSQKHILFIINKYLFPKKIKNIEKKQILINCLMSNNYITEKEIVSNYDDAFEHAYFQQEQVQEQVQKQIQEQIQMLPGFTQREHTSVNPYGFNSTFINPDDDSLTKRLIEVQKRGTTPEETDFINVSNKIDTALNRVSTDLNFETIKTTALNIYLNITKFYIYQEQITKDKRIIQGENKGSVKKGYILLSLYYALINNNIYIAKNKLITYFSDISLSDLPKADENLKIIFEKNHSYQFIFEELRLKNNSLTANLTKEQKEQVNKVIDDLIETGLFNNPPTYIQVAASIVYILDNLKEISKKSDISDVTIRNNVKFIEKFYK